MPSTVCITLTSISFLLLFIYSNSDDKTTTISVQSAADVESCKIKKFVRVGSSYLIGKKEKVTFQEAEKRCKANKAQLVNLNELRKSKRVTLWVKRCIGREMLGPFFVNVVESDGKFTWRDDPSNSTVESNARSCVPGRNSTQRYFGPKPNSKYLGIKIYPSGYCFEGLLANETAYYICEKYD